MVSSSNKIYKTNAFHCKTLLKQNSQLLPTPHWSKTEICLTYILVARDCSIFFVTVANLMQWICVATKSAGQNLKRNEASGGTFKSAAPFSRFFSHTHSRLHYFWLSRYGTFWFPHFFLSSTTKKQHRSFWSPVFLSFCAYFWSTQWSAKCQKQICSSGMVCAPKLSWQVESKVNSCDSISTGRLNSTSVLLNPFNPNTAVQMRRNEPKQVVLNTAATVASTSDAAFHFTAQAPTTIPRCTARPTICRQLRQTQQSHRLESMSRSLAPDPGCWLQLWALCPY